MRPVKRADSSGVDDGNCASWMVTRWSVTTRRPLSESERAESVTTP
jgi:hypothetical protein